MVSGTSAYSTCFVRVYLLEYANCTYLRILDVLRQGARLSRGWGWGEGLGARARARARGSARLSQGWGWGEGLGLGLGLGVAPAFRRVGVGVRG
jgi:hypothetical protein